MATYSEKLKDPRWQRLRLEVLDRDDFTCQICFDSTTTLSVHHRYYIKGREPWDYPLQLLITLCQPCHEEEGKNAVWGHLDRHARGCGLFESDVANLCDAIWFYFTQANYPPSVALDVLMHHMKKPNQIDAMEERYFAHIKEVNNEKV
jgi:hypothetical protein